MKLKQKIPGEILFFPRKIVKVATLDEKEPFFITRRTDERSRGLLCPSKDNYEGLTSGLRSAIIYDENEGYIRLKGVSLGVANSHRNKKTSWGLCLFLEAYYEQKTALWMMHEAEDLTAINPIRLYFFENRESEHKIRVLKYPSSRLSAAVDRFYGLLWDGSKNIPVVSAYKITGDTRIDEAIYQLTKPKLFGKRKNERNELLKYLSFQSGRTIAKANSRNFAWIYGEGATDSHLGNFVLDRDGDKLNIKLTDLQGMCSISDLKKIKYVEKDILAYKEDFYAQYTTSLPTCLAYRDFSDELRAECFKRFLEGYASMKVKGIDIGVKSNEVVPKMPEVEFREKVDYILGESR